MDGFLSMTRSRSGLPWPTINVCECNADVSDDGSRPQFFGNLAQWRYSDGGRRMLTFFPDPAGPHSVSWEVYRVWGVITPGMSWFVPAKSVHLPAIRGRCRNCRLWTRISSGDATWLGVPNGGSGRRVACCPGPLSRLIMRRR
jgi:hypothetical protein